MPDIPNITNIPAARVPLVDPITGGPSQAWYRWFLNQFVLTGGGTTPTTLADLQVAPQIVDISGDFSNLYEQAQLASLAGQVVSLTQAQTDVDIPPSSPQLGTISPQNAENVAITGGAIDGTTIGAATRAAGSFTTATLTNPLAIGSGGTNSTATATAGGIGYGTGTAHAYSAAGTAGQVLTSAGAGAPTWTAAATGTVTSVAQTFTGGLISVAGSPITTSGTLALTVAGTSGGVPYFSGASTWASSAALAANAIVLGGGAGAAPATTTTGTGVVTAINNAVNTSGGLCTSAVTTLSSLASIGTITTGTWNGSIVSGTYGGTGVNNGSNVITIGGNVTFLGAFGFTGTLTNTTSVTFPTSGTLVNSAVTTLSSLASVGTITTGTWNGSVLGIAYGGTNSTATATAGGVGYGTGTAHAYTAAGTSGQVLTSAGAGAPTWATPTTGTVTSVAQSFTGGLISVGGSPVTSSGTLALTVAGTSGGIPYFSSSSAWASSAALAANAIVIGGGAGAAPATTTTGTGVLTAIGNAVNGSGGLCTSAVTTLSSLASVGTITTGVWNAGAVTSSGAVSGTSHTMPSAYGSYGHGAYQTGSTQTGYWSGNSNTGGGSTAGTFFGVATDGSGLIYVGSSLALNTYVSGVLKCTLSAAGAFRWHNYGAGAATFDASGNITSVSDPSQKVILGGFDAGLPEIIAAASPEFMGLHKWTLESGMETEGTYASFFARDHFPIPNAVAKNPETGINSFSDRPVIMALCNAVSTLAARVAELEAKVA